MSTIWFPVPVATLFRRLVNVISTASIAHHYLLPSKSSPASDDFPLELDLDPRSVSRLLWENALPAPPRTTRAADDLDGILKGARERTHITLSFSSPHARTHAIAFSGRLSIPWPRWPLRLSLLYPSSRSAQQLAEPPRTDGDGGRSSAPIPRSNPNRHPPPTEKQQHENRGAIHRLMHSPVLYDPLRAPRFPIVLCHGACAHTHLPSHPRCNFFYKSIPRRVIRLRRPRTSELAYAVLVYYPRYPPQDRRRRSDRHCCSWHRLNCLARRTPR